MSRFNENPTVYSTEQGRMCPKCGRSVTTCTCHKQKAIPQGDGIVRIRLESKGRGGKKVTTISGVVLADEALRQLAADLKRICGTGGTVKDGVIEIQGDHRDPVFDEIKRRGFVVKKAGG